MDNKDLMTKIKYLKDKYNIMDKKKLLFLSTAVVLFSGASSELNKGESSKIEQKRIIAQKILEETKKAEALVTTEEYVTTKIEEEKVDLTDEIINNYKEINTVDDILERQKELESLNLSDDYKLYKDCILSPELQLFIQEQATLHNVPTDFVFSIIHIESNGEFSSSGALSSTGDVGLTQQNKKCSVKGIFCKIYDIDYDKAVELVRYNDYVNIVACMHVIDCIRGKKDFNVESIAGSYNGGGNWKKIRRSRTYAKHLKEVYDEKYNLYHESEKQYVMKK